MATHTDQPTKLPEWASGGSITEPSAGTKSTGCVVNQRLPAQYGNWLWNLMYLWICWFLEIVLWGRSDEAVTITGLGPNTLAAHAWGDSRSGMIRVYQGAGPDAPLAFTMNVPGNTYTDRNAIVMLFPADVASGTLFQNTRMCATYTGTKGSWSCGSVDNAGTSTAFMIGYQISYVPDSLSSPFTTWQGWQALHSYVVGDYCTNDSGKLYECITAGLSAAATGPTGTTADITDGTAHWKYAGT